MNSWLFSLSKNIQKKYYSILTRYGRLDEINTVLSSTGGHYLDEFQYAKMFDINIDKAKTLLLQAMDDGILTKKFIWADDTTGKMLLLDEVDFTITYTYADLGWDAEDPEEIVEIDKFDAREVYVATAS